MMTKRIFRLLACSVAILCLQGCLLSYPARTERTFSKFARDYASRLRWMDYSAAASFMNDDVKSDFQEAKTSLEEIQVVDVVLETVDLESGEREGFSTILLEYYRLPSVSVRKTRIRQKWVFREAFNHRGGEWKIETPFPEIP